MATLSTCDASSDVKAEPTDKVALRAQVRLHGTPLWPQGDPKGPRWGPLGRVLGVFFGRLGCLLGSLVG